MTSSGAFGDVSDANAAWPDVTDHVGAGITHAFLGATSSHES